MTSIGVGTFEFCSGLTSITIPNSVTSIGGWAFYGCSGLTSVTIPNSVTTIGESAFQSCSGLTTITIPNSVTSIGGSAFYGCSGLISITIGNSLTSIGYSAFTYCSALTAVYISDLAAWCKVSFNENPLIYAHHLYLEEEEIIDLVIPNGVTSIGKNAFIGCNNLTSVEIPNDVTSIGEGAFAYCSGLTSITIPNNVTSIGESAFCGCSGLTSVTIPNSVTIIGKNAFSGCSSMEALKLPDQLQIIRNAAFYGCNSLKSVTIPASVEFIYQEAFANCNALRNVKALPDNPPFLYDNSFSNFSIPLRVPKGCKEAYQTSQGWKNFTNISDADKYKLIYVVDEEEYKSYEIEEGTSITPEPAPTKEGYTFSGWDEIPETMPAHDLTVTGTFSINSYKLTYMIDDEVYKETMYEYGATITPELQPERDYTTFEWIDLPQTMPAHDVVVYASYTSGINEVLITKQRNSRVYSPNGKKLDKLQKGLNIVVLDDGTVKKVVVK